MLPITADALRVSLHVLAATVWVGGQITLAALVPIVRPAGPETVSAAARRFQLIAWPAFVVLLATGVWNLYEVSVLDATSEYQATLLAKLGLVALSGIGAYAHTLFGTQVRLATEAGDERRARRYRAITGASAGIALLAALGALLMGVMLDG